MCVCMCVCDSMQHGQFSYSERRGLSVIYTGYHVYVYTSIEVGRQLLCASPLKPSNQSTVLFNIEKFTSMILKPAGTCDNLCPHSS